MPMKIYIKNMFTKLCKETVKQELDKLDLTYIFVELGEIELMEDLTTEQLNILKEGVGKYGFEIMENKKSVLIEKIINVIVEMVHLNDRPQKLKISNYLSEKLNHNYTYMANVFSEVKGISIEQFIINHKIEKIKELLIYDELSLSQIADQLGYSSLAYMSNQFKKATGLTLSNYKDLKDKIRKPVEDIN